jgi:hypothetical protein
VQGGPLVFAPFKTGTDYWAADKQFMLNLRVIDLDSLLEQLKPIFPPFEVRRLGPLQGLSSAGSPCDAAERGRHPR